MPQLMIGIADDQLVNGAKAYGWPGVVALAQANNGKTAGENTAWQNCDTQNIFALGELTLHLQSGLGVKNPFALTFIFVAMLMDKCNWSQDLAQQA